MICRIVTACKLVINKQLKLQNSFKIRMSETCLSFEVECVGKKKPSHIDLKSWLLDLAALSFIDLNTDTRRTNSSSLLKMLLIYISACIFCVCLHHCWEKETSSESSWIFSAFICLRNSHSIRGRLQLHPLRHLTGLPSGAPAHICDSCQKSQKLLISKLSSQTLLTSPISQVYSWLSRQVQTILCTSLLLLQIFGYIIMSILYDS